MAIDLQTQGVKEFPVGTVAELGSETPTIGLLGFATDGRKNGETATNGTGVLVFGDGSDWCAVDTGAAVAA